MDQTWKDSPCVCRTRSEWINRSAYIKLGMSNRIGSRRCDHYLGFPIYEGID